MAIIDNFIHSSGGGGSSQNMRTDYSDILEYSEVEEKWTRVGEMSQPRVFGAVSVVNFDEYKKYCQYVSRVHSDSDLR